MLCIDETGDRKKGKTTDYIAHQYIGNLGKLAHGIVSVNAYGILDHITSPLLFYVVAIRSNHGVWLPPGQRVRSTNWRPSARIFSNGDQQTRYIREIIFGQHLWAAHLD